MLEILFEDASVRVINKPSGIHSVSEPPSIESLLKQTFPSDAFINDSKYEAGIVHRLDFETSGVLLAAKNLKSWTEIKAKFKTGSINKNYLALVEGEISAENLHHWIGGRYRGSKKVSVYDRPKERTQEAILSYKLIRYYPAEDFSAVSINLITGVRHQIRAQLAKIGHPLVADKLYGSERTLETGSFFLHAKTLLSYSAPVPLEFQRYFIK